MPNCWPGGRYLPGRRQVEPPPGLFSPNCVPPGRGRGCLPRLGRYPGERSGGVGGAPRHQPARPVPQAAAGTAGCRVRPGQPRSRAGLAACGSGRWRVERERRRGSPGIEFGPNLPAAPRRESRPSPVAEVAHSVLAPARPGPGRRARRRCRQQEINGRVVVQRVHRGPGRVCGLVSGAIGPGLWFPGGFEADDGDADLGWMAGKPRFAYGGFSPTRRG